jgi:hypothetical protein
MAAWHIGKRPEMPIRLTFLPWLIHAYAPVKISALPIQTRCGCESQQPVTFDDIPHEPHDKKL